MEIAARAAGRAAGGCHAACRAMGGPPTPHPKSSGTAQHPCDSSPSWFVGTGRGLAELLPEGRGKMLWCGMEAGGSPCLGRGSPGWLRRHKRVPKLANGCLERGAGAWRGVLAFRPPSVLSPVPAGGVAQPGPPGAVPELPDEQVRRQRWRLAPSWASEPRSWAATGKTACSGPACSWGGLNGRGN